MDIDKPEPSHGWRGYVREYRRSWLKIMAAAVVGFAVLGGFIAYLRPLIDRPEVRFAVDVQHALNEQLRDYPSARFANVRFAVLANGHREACGRINAKNGFGEYGGWRQFTADQAPGGPVTISFEDHCKPAAWSTTDDTARLQPR